MPAPARELPYRLLREASFEVEVTVGEHEGL
jgi:hypothetical protein